MKKFAIALAVFAAMIVSANAEWLYWQVDASHYVNSTVANDSNAQSRLYYWDGSTMTLLGAASGTNQGEYNTSWNQTISSDPSAYSYWIETGTYTGDTSSNLQYFGEFTYQQLALSGTQLTAANMRALVTASTRHDGHVPEPTSGLMMIVGMALLGLKRRRV